jgi:Tetratricopeptide repeat
LTPAAFISHSHSVAQVNDHANASLHMSRSPLPLTRLLALLLARVYY